MGQKADLATLEEFIALPSGVAGETVALPGEELAASGEVASTGAETVTKDVEQAASTGVQDVEQAASTGVQDAAALLTSVQNQTNRVHDWLANQPTPGGVGMLLLMLLFLMWAIIPVNSQGYTRVQLLWYTLVGRTTLPGRVQVQGAQSAVPSSGAPPPTVDLGPFGMFNPATPWGYS